MPVSYAVEVRNDAPRAGFFHLSAVKAICKTIKEKRFMMFGIF